MIRVGIWGTGSIANRIMADFGRGESYSLRAIASRSLEKAQAFQKKYGVPLALEGAQALAQRSDIDLVYVASPHPFHMADALLFLKSGKHVLCEKPFALNDGQAKGAIAYAREHGLFFMEAMWTRFLPAVLTLKECVSRGDIGDVRLITANFGYAAAFDAESRVYNMNLGGGSLLDVGVYALSFACYLLGPGAEIQAAHAVKAPSGADASLSFQLTWPSGACAQLFSAVDTSTEARAMIYGTKGYIEMPGFWHAEGFTVNAEGAARVFCFDKENEGHYHQFEHAAQMIERGETESPVMPLHETEEILRIMTDLRRRTNILYPEEQEDAEA